MHGVTTSYMDKRYTQNTTPIDFNASEYKKSIDMASYFTLQQIFRKLSLAEFQCRIRE